MNEIQIRHTERRTTGNNGNLRKVDPVVGRKHHNDDWNGLIHGEDIDRVYCGRDKEQVSESLRFLVDNAYITVDNNEKEDIVGIPDVFLGVG